MNTTIDLDELSKIIYQRMNYNEEEKDIDYINLRETFFTDDNLLEYRANSLYRTCSNLSQDSMESIRNETAKLNHTKFQDIRNYYERKQNSDRKQFLKYLYSNLLFLENMMNQTNLEILKVNVKLNNFFVNNLSFFSNKKKLEEEKCDLLEKNGRIENIILNVQKLIPIYEEQ